MSHDFVVTGQAQNSSRTASPLRIQANQGHFQNSLSKSKSLLGQNSKTHSSSSKSTPANKFNQSNFQFLRLGSSRSDSMLDTQVQSLNGSSNFIKNTLDSAQNIGDFSGKTRYRWSDTLDASNSDDFFKFSLSNRGKVDVSLGKQGTANLRLLKGNGAEIKRSTGSTISSSLRSGTYYVQVSSDSNTNYSLDLKGSGIANDAGSTTQAALDAGDLSRTNRTFRRKIGAKDTVDVYQFDLTERSKVELALGNLRKDASLQLLDSSGNEISLSDSQGSTGKSINKQLDAGTYYVKVKTASKSSMRYVLEMNTGVLSSNSGGFDFDDSDSNGGSNNSGGFGGSLGGGISTNGDRPILRLSKTSAKTSSGLVQLQLELVQGNKVLDKVVAISGIAGKQNFRLPSQSQSGSMEPLPEGKWSLGSPEWAGNAKGDFNSSWGEGLGPVWVSVEPLMSTQRSAIGIHLDSNASYSPGTAGCIGVTSKNDLQKVVSWFDNSLAPKTVVVDWGLGSVVA
jgi:Bacterial pre-peptidase C-terminal domain